MLIPVPQEVAGDKDFNTVFANTAPYCAVRKLNNIVKLSLSNMKDMIITFTLGLLFIIKITKKRYLLLFCKI